MEKPEVVQRYEEQIAKSENIYLDPVEIEDIYRYYAEQENGEALGTLLRVGQSLYPDEPVVRQLDAEYELNMGNPEKALEKIDLIFSEESPYLCILKSAALAKLHREAEAMDMAEAARYDEQPEDFVSYDLAVGFMNADMFTTALHYFSTSVKNHPDDVRTLTGMLYCYTKLGQLDQLPELSEKILQLDPFNYDAWMAKGNTLSHNEHFEEAIEAYDYATAIAPDECDPIVLKALCLNMLNRADEADQLMEDAVSRAQSYQLTTICFRLAERSLLKGDKEAAKQYIWRGVNGSPNFVETLTEAAKLFRRAGDQQARLEMMQSARQLEPDDEGILCDLADAFNDAQQYDDAALLYERLNNEHPNAAYVALWGSTQMSLGRHEQAYRLFKKANQQEEIYQTYILMAVCDFELKLPLRLKEDFSMAYAMNPDNSIGLLTRIVPEAVQMLEDSGYLEEIKQAYEEAVQKRFAEKVQQTLDNKEHDNENENENENH